MHVRKMLFSSFSWKFLQFGSSFLLNILVARVLGAGDSASLFYLAYLFSGFITLFTLGLDIGLTYYLPRKQISLPTAGKLIMAVSLFATVVSLSVLAIWSGAGEALHMQTSQLLLYGGMQIAGGLATSLCSAVFTANRRNDIPSKIALALNIVTGVVIFFAGRDRLASIFGVWFGAGLLQGLVCLILAGRKYGRMGKSEERHADGAVSFLRLLRFSSGAFIINLIFFAGARAGIYLLPYRTDAAGLGNYIQAYKLVEYTGNITSFLYFPMIALVAGIDVELMKSRILLMVRLSNTVVLLLSIGLLVTGRWLFPLLFGASFDEVWGIVCGFIPGLFAVCSSSFFTAWFYGSGHLRFNAVSACINLGAMLVGFFLFPAPFGTAWAFSLAALLSLGYDLVVFRRYRRWQIGDIGLLKRSDLSLILRTGKR
jgi:O-antigen/teichoic acid export membrane protein